MATPKLNANLVRCRNREEWLAERRKRVTASDVATLFGVGHGSPYSLFQDKRNPVLVDATSQRQRLGLRGENVVIDELVHTYGGRADRLDEYTIVENSDKPWLSCTPDALYQCPERPGVGNLQIKTWSEFDKASWAEGPPLPVQVQVQCEMLAMGLDWSAVGVAFGFASVERFFVDRNERFIEALLVRAEEFYGYLLDALEPPLDDTEATRQALQRLHPDDNGETVAMPAAYEATLEKLERINDVLKKVQARKTRLQNELRHQIGDNTYGVLPNGRAVSWKTQDRAEYTVAATSMRVLRTHKKLPKSAKEPRVIDHKKHSRVRLPKRLKQRLLTANNRCRWCGCELTIKTATFERLVPLAVGGDNSDGNISLSCVGCNQNRGDDATIS